MQKRKPAGCTGCIGCLGGGGLLLIAMMVIAAFAPDAPPTGGAKPPAPANWRNKDASIEASIMAEEFVKDRLKSPSTAKFPWYSRDSVKSIGPQQYRVRSYVDSQNSFGAMLRTKYVVDLEQTAPDKWRLLDLTTSE